MKIYSIPQNLKTIIFDIDGTLYTNPQYVFEQVDAQVRHFAHLRGMEESEARKAISDYRKKWSTEHSGKKISLGNTLTAFGISIEESIKWRETLLAPEKYLSRDEKLLSSLAVLKKKYKLICITNNPVEAARKTLAAIGADKLLPDIIGLDTCLRSKPDRAMLELAVERTNSDCSQCLSIGDRYDIDLALPLEMGMGAILVTGAEELYNLNEVIESKNSLQ